MDKYEKAKNNLIEGKNMSFELFDASGMPEEQIEKIKQLVEDAVQIGVNAIELRKQIETSNKKNLICKNCNADGNCTCK